MIVVVGQPLYRVAEEEEPGVDGLVARVALSAAVHCREVQLVGKAGEDPEGDAVVLALAHGGVGHVALRRDAGMPTPRARVSAASDGDAPAGDADLEADLRVGSVPASDRAALDAADVELALRYLTSFNVLVLGQPADPEVHRVVGTAAEWADARLIVVLPAGDAVPDGLPPDAIVFEAPDDDPDGVFASLVGSFAAALDAGDEPADAFRDTLAGSGWTPSAAD